MDIGIISNRYSKALLQFAHDNAEAHAVYAEMQRLCTAYKKVSKLRTFLSSPNLSVAEKHGLLSAACAQNKMNVTKTTDTFLNLVLKNHREDCLLVMAYSYISLFQDQERIVQGRLIVATPINETLQKRFINLIEKHTNKHVDFKVKVDTQIDGGFVLEFDTYRLDASLRTQLQQIGKKLMRIQ